MLNPSRASKEEATSSGFRTVSAVAGVTSEISENFKHSGSIAKSGDPWQTNSEERRTPHAEAQELLA